MMHFTYRVRYRNWGDHQVTTGPEAVFEALRRFKEEWKPIHFHTESIYESMDKDEGQIIWTVSFNGIPEAHNLLESPDCQIRRDERDGGELL